MLGGRKGSTPLSYNLQPQAQYVFDPITRRAVRYVEDIVPTIHAADSANTRHLPADRYYAPIGVAASASVLPLWCNVSGGTITFQNWDSTNERFYTRLSGGAGASRINSAGIYPFWRSGPSGAAADYAPKNASVTKLILQFTARFNANADYGQYGIGMNSSASSFFSGSSHFIQVLRNAGNWELGSCDGTTISQAASSGGADGSWHSFRVEWDSSSIVLYVDGTAVITKTTNLPGEAMELSIHAQDNTNTFDIVDYLVRWE